MKLKNNWYDITKYIAIVALPALTTFIGTVGSQLGYNVTAILVFLTAFNTFLGTCLGISSINYNKENDNGY